MANKYLAESRAAQEQRRQERSCTNKKRYANQAEALNNWHKLYQCQYCHGFHLSGLLLRLAKQGQRFLMNRGVKS